VGLNTIKNKNCQ